MRARMRVLKNGRPVMPIHEADLVTVLEVTDSFVLMLAKSSLEEAGIEYVVSGDNPRYLAGIPGGFGVGEIPLGTKCSCSIQVSREFERGARALLEPLQQRAAVPDIE
jgi:Putative prokaryotic signal transducing protein